MDNLAALLKELVSRVAAIFDIFDLSFFVAGGFSVLALRYLLYLLAVPFPEPRGEVLPVVVAVLLSYVLGHLCFTLGRRVRRVLRPDFALSVYTKGEQTTLQLSQRKEKLGQDEYIRQLLRSHRLDRLARYARYLKRAETEEDASYFATLYPLMWVEMRQNPALTPSMRLISAYWVRAAIYDGLVPALLLWILAVATAWHLQSPSVGQPWVAGPAMAILGVGCAFCFLEAQRCDKYQMEELVATLRWWSDQQGHQPPVGSP